MRWFLCVCFCLFSMAGHGASTLDLHAKTYQLNNGLALIVIPDQRAPVVISQIWYKVGSAYETPGISGISHMLEHMMFKGTKRFPHGTLMHLIAENGGDQNAATSRDFTYYYESLPADKLALSFELEADRMVNLDLKESDFQTENHVVQEERRLRTEDVPASQLFERFSAAAHLSPPYHHPTVGWMHDIQQLTLADLTHWYHQWYAPNNATVVVVGDVKPAKVYRLAKKYFGSLKPNTQLPVSKDLREPPALGPRHVIVATPAKVPVVLMGYNTPNFKTAPQAWQPYALALTKAILAGGDSARLPARLLRQQQKVVDIDADYSPYTLFPDVFTISAVPSQNQSVAKVVSAIQAQIKQLQTEPVSKAELDKVKNQVIAQHIFDQDPMSGKATQVGVLASLNLPWQTVNTYVTKIQSITPDQIQAVAKQYLIARCLTVATLTPLPENVSIEKKD